MTDNAGVGFSSVGLAVGLPFSSRPTTPLWGVALATQAYPLNTTVTHVVIQDVEIGEARNAIVDHALALNATYIWFVDDDVVLPPFAAQRLGYALDTKGPKTFPDSKIAVCGGIYCSKEELSTPVVYKKNGQGASWDWKLNEIFEVESIGTGCMMIAAEVFKHLEKPYFKTVEEYTPAPNGQMGCTKMTDDIYFCEKVKKAGFTILAHGGVLCGHYDLRTKKIFTLPEDSPPVLAAKEDEANQERLRTEAASTTSETMI
jgi:hypothetical protein